MNTNLKVEEASMWAFDRRQASLNSRMLLGLEAKWLCPTLRNHLRIWVNKIKTQFLAEVLCNKCLLKLLTACGHSRRNLGSSMNSWRKDETLRIAFSQCSHINSLNTPILTSNNSTWQHNNRSINNNSRCRSRNLQKAANRLLMIQSVRCCERDKCKRCEEIAENVFGNQVLIEYLKIISFLLH